MKRIDFSNEFLGSLNFAQSKQNQIRSKRGQLLLNNKLFQKNF